MLDKIKVPDLTDYNTHYKIVFGFLLIALLPIWLCCLIVYLLFYGAYTTGDVVGSYLFSEIQNNGSNKN